MNKPFITHSEVTDRIYVICGRDQYEVTDQVIRAMKSTGRLPERKKGKWVDLRCNQCGQVDMSKPYFCPNCGADMRGEQDEN